VGGFWKRQIRRWCPSPESERISAALESATIELEHRRANQDDGGKQAGWLTAVEGHLAKARCAYGEEHYQIGWREIKAADRTMLEDPKDALGVEARAATLRREAEAVGGRRAKAIVDLLCDANGKLLPNLSGDRTRIIEAAELRDEHYDTLYYRIELRRRHLINLFILLLISLVLLLALAYFGKIELFRGTDPNSGSFGRLVTVILLGMLGASLSVAQTVVASDINAKIPSQLVGAFMVWMRPVIGATAAVVAYVLLLANEHMKIFEPTLAQNFKVVCVIALVAGFSERFIVGALNRVADSQSGDKAKS
jgi:hypothetical protein